MKKVLNIITTGIASYGGLTTVAMNYYRAMDREGLQIDFAADNPIEDALLSELEQNGSRYIQLPLRKHVFSYMNSLLHVLKDYDVVHIHGNSATMFLELLPAVLRRVPVRIAHTHTTRPESKKLNKIFKPFFKKMYTAGLAVSGEAGEVLYGKKPFTVLNNAIDLERYQFCKQVREQVRAELQIKNDTVVLGHVGKIYQPKNHPFLVDVFAVYHQKNPNSRLVLVGDGVMRGEIEEQVQQLGLSDDVIFMGMRNDTEKWMQEMDCFVFPSFYEGFPLSLAEAQANGLPCLFSDRIAKKAAILSTALPLSIEDSPESWAEQIEKTELVRMPQKQLSEAFQKAHMDIKKEAGALRNIYCK